MVPSVIARGIFVICVGSTFGASMFLVTAAYSVSVLCSKANEYAKRSEMITQMINKMVAHFLALKLVSMRIYLLRIHRYDFSHDNPPFELMWSESENTYETGN